DAAPAQGLREGARGRAGQLDEAGVEEGRVLTLEQADAAQPRGERPRHVGTLLAEDGRRFLLARSVQGREDRGHCDGSDPHLAYPPGRRPHAPRVEGHEGPAGELVTALEHHYVS